MLLVLKDPLDLMDLRGSKVREVQMVSEAILALQVSLVKQDRQVQSALRVILEQQARPVLRVSWDPQVLQGPRETKDPRVQLVARAP